MKSMGKRQMRRLVVVAVCQISLLPLFQVIAAQQSKSQLLSSMFDLQANGAQTWKSDLLSQPSSTASDLRPSPVRSLPPELDGAASTAHIIKHSFPIRVMADGLTSPDSIAIHPLTREIYLSEEDAGRISILLRDHAVKAIDDRTPIYSKNDAGEVVRERALQNPEGIAFGAYGDLFVVEDIAGGRVIRFEMDKSGRYDRGEVLSLPGGWSDYAWEDVDVGPEGELIIAGSNIEAAMGKRGLSVFSGALLYRDRAGSWWKTLHRDFTSYSAVRFSKTGKQAVYACEFSGEVGWLNLETRQVLNGCIDQSIKSVEGITLLPDGRILVVSEDGKLIHIDPTSGVTQTLYDRLGSLENAIWDSQRKELLITQDAEGKVFSLKFDENFDTTENALDYVTYWPQNGSQFVPAQCPDYLRRVLTLGGLEPGDESLPFTEIVNKIPMIAADMDVVPLNEDSDYSDPIQHVQFVVFHPNKISFSEEGLPSAAFGVFVAKKRSGEATQTSLARLQSAVMSGGDGKVEIGAPISMVVPQPGPVSVSTLGVTTVQFLGMGQTPDYSVVINPKEPDQSYMVVHLSDGTIEQYSLSLPKATSAESLVIAFKSVRTEEWSCLEEKETSMASN